MALLQALVCVSASGACKCAICGWQKSFKFFVRWGKLKHEAVGYRVGKRSAQWSVFLFSALQHPGVFLQYFYYYGRLFSNSAIVRKKHYASFFPVSSIHPEFLEFIKASFFALEYPFSCIRTISLKSPQGFCRLL